MTDPAEAIRRRASKVVRGVLQDDVGFARWVKRMVAHTVTEYRGRFIHELVQNGYDAHPVGTTTGRIAVHFDETEADHGVLYVANGGQPLSEDNFNRMASLGDSDKEIGVGIGNKGIGFKSVFQVCQVPEVYSARDHDDPGLSGFTFRFGTMDDLVEELDRDEELAARVEQNLSLSLLTAPLTKIPAAVADYRTQGYVTIVRLPAASATAAEEIRERISGLLASPAPLMLFLERLESLSVRASRDEEPVVLRRRVVSAEGNQPWQRVVLDDTSFRLFSAQVDPGRLRAALEESVERGTLDERWLRWNSEAFVSVAVGDGPTVREGRIFTYLPMGEEAESPLDGHINAPFVTNLARVGLDHEQPVNRLLIECVAELCLDVAATIAERSGDANTSLDLLAWRDRVEVLDLACRRTRGRNLADFVVLPTLLKEWRPLTETCTWNQADTRVITAEILTSDCGAVLADPGRIDPDRLDAAADLAESLGLSLEPDDAQKAAWVETLTAAMRDRGATLATWAAFYDDLPLIFDSGEPLQGRAILYAADDSLAPCNEPIGAAPAGSGRRRRQRSVFFSPMARGDRLESEDATDDSLSDAQGSDGEPVDIRPPRTLNNRITFMHPDLDWYAGSQRRPGREFLESTHLVQPFRTERLLGLMARVMLDSPTEALKRDSLYFAFRLLGGQPDRHARDLGAVGLQVPTQSGAWVPATSARFGGAWSLPGADDLTQLAAAATEETPELASLRGILVADPTEFPGGGGQETMARWQAFLATLGLTTALPIREALDTRTISGRQLTTARITGSGIPDGVPAGVVEQWRDGLDETGNWSHPDTAFTTTDPLYWFLGQHEVGLLPGRLRSRYAHLVVRTLPALKPAHRVSTWKRRQPYGTDSRIPTPLACFIDSQAWVPNQRGGEEPAFRRPDRSWYAAIEDQMAAYYSPLVEARLRRTLESLPNPTSTMRAIGLRVWGSRDDAAALIDYLTELFESREVNDAAAADHVRSSLADAWNEIRGPALRNSPILDTGLIVERSGHLELLNPDTAGAERVFVTGARDTSTTAKLIRELGWPMLTVNSEDPDRLRDVAEHVLRPRWHGDVVVTPDWDIEVLTDGLPWRPDTDATLLTGEIPWLPLVFACTMRFPRSGSAVGKNLERHMDDLARVRLMRCSRLSIATAGGEQPLPPRLRGVLPVPGDQPTLLIEAGDAPLSWGRLDPVASAALELMGQTRFTAELALTLEKLATDTDSPAEAPDAADVADVLGVELVRVAEIERRIYGAVSVALTRLLPAAVCLWGEQALDTLSFGTASSREEVLAALTRLTSEDSSEAARLLHCASEAADANAVRLALSIPLHDFNTVLEQHFPSIPPVDNSGRHLEEFRLRRTQRRPELLNWLRASRLPAFEAGRSQPDWTELRDLDFLTPDPAWGASLDDLPEGIIDDRIDRQVTEAFGPQPASWTLSDAAEVRQANGAPLRERLAKVQKVAIAWHRKNSSEPRGELGPDFVDNAMRALNSAGTLDFVPLDGDLLATWLNRVGIWPSPMPLTLDPAALGLTDADMTEATNQSDAAREERLKVERQVTLHGSVMEVEPSMANLIARLSEHLATSPTSLATPYRFTTPQTMTDAGQRGSRGSRRPSSRSAPRPQRLSDTQRNAIGIAGELTAFHWLRAKERSPLDETCWRSTYVSYVYEGALGDDSLGYDFEVPRADGSVLYEVKATSGDASMIELGESEVACAQEHARSRRWRLLIVEDVLSTEPSVLMLPNPFGRDTRSLYRFVGNSVRLRFRL
ncbi:sacsin N-terminal ATP-binding-like domain-containing protein [Kribbella sp. NPDC004138]